MAIFNKVEKIIDEPTKIGDTLFILKKGSIKETDMKKLEKKWLGKDNLDFDIALKDITINGTQYSKVSKTNQSYKTGELLELLSKYGKGTNEYNKIKNDLIKYYTGYKEFDAEYKNNKNKYNSYGEYVLEKLEDVVNFAKRNDIPVWQLDKVATITGGEAAYGSKNNNNNEDVKMVAKTLIERYFDERTEKMGMGFKYFGSL
ncbi:hypothetical protein OSSY52_13780 [Tepiditoga spiralis]|uniref:Uncharacterized protein n=2 Tax=Tepiditoga spiralis TaxID=2108365 RepID=A0A7G1G8G1_9BACT|nr:hypothetical protein OSSY52_13780 [Tepiditoga spiralis]